jgi:Tfp pilus assembly protein PilW
MRALRTRSRGLARAAVRGVRGFTIIELLMVCGCTILLAGAILGIYEGLIKSWADTSNRITNQDDARLAINEISRYIRMAQNSESNLTSISDALEVTSPDDLVFYSDINGDGYAERCRFYLSGQALRLATVAPDMTTSPATYAGAYTGDGVVVLSGVRNGSTAVFTYYRLNPAYITNPVAANDTLVPVTPSTAADRASVVAIGVTLYINEAPELSKGNVDLNTLIQIRQRYNGGLSGA